MAKCISPADAAPQVARVVQARGISVPQINALLERHITGRSLGIFGEPRVNVLALNLAVQDAHPKPSSDARTSGSLGLQYQAP